MIFSDVDILRGACSRELSITPWKQENVQPASYDLSLGPDLIVYLEGAAFRSCVVVPTNLDMCPPFIKTVTMAPGDWFDLAPGAFILGTTEERVLLSPKISGTVMGRSSLGRLGLIVHATAGFVDPGFEGKITLEMANLSPQPIRLTVGMSIAQIAFTELRTPAELPYGHPSRKSKYQHQSNVQQSKGV